MELYQMGSEGYQIGSGGLSNKNEENIMSK